MMAMAHKLLGECYANLGRLQEAKTELIASEKLDPTDPQIHYLLARLYQRSRDLSASQQEMEQFKKLSSPQKANP
jgi:Flp pilus assembly protein TadD